MKGKVIICHDESKPRPLWLYKELEEINFRFYYTKTLWLSESKINWHYEITFDNITDLSYFQLICPFELKIFDIEA